MFYSQKARIVWNNQYSDWFEINNGVKQGGVLSSVLFCVYIDDLLIALKSGGYGCFVGHMFTGVMAYAVDLVLLTLSQRAMRQMLRLCEDYAGEYDMLLNASKSKSIVCKDCDDKRDIMNHRSRFISQVNNIICVW